MSTRPVLWWWLTSFWRRCHCGEWASFGKDSGGILWCTECKYAVKRGCECSGTRGDFWHGP